MFDPFASDDEGVFDVRTTAAGPAGTLPLTEVMLRESASGDLFGLSQNVGMGWSPAAAADRQFLVLSTQGGLRAPDGSPVALGYHTGHWEIGLLVEAAARELRRLGTIPFAGACSDPCDGRTQGTTGMFDSLPYRNDAAIVLRRLARSLPRREGVLGIATCDKGLPAMLMAIAGLGDLPGVIMPGGVTLPPAVGEDAGTIQTIGTRFALGTITTWAAGPAPRPGAAASFWARPPRPRWWPRPSGSRCRTRRSRLAASRSGGISRCGRPALWWGSPMPAARPGRSSRQRQSPMR